MNTAASVLVGIALIIGVGGLVYWQTQGAQNIPTPNDGPRQGGISAAEVAAHNGGTSCWSIINGSVYDLTSWIPQHPGGEQAILQLCGTDGSEKFNGVHGGMATQAQVLAGFKIGELAQ
ncbi:MAG TPA: cytochrome b5-like heme/steroid binding domain-containing protein [Candidatus Paceibacterota bacterium]|nr:cytochrome b5-like heme/steroid binding domain-containing protein [Candidatus Paceibacterota bacterium]